MSARENIIPVFVPHLGCPNDCVFCNQRKISGSLFPAFFIDTSYPMVLMILIKGSITDRNYRVERGANKAQKVLGAVALVLAFAVIWLIAKYYPMIWQ